LDLVLNTPACGGSRLEEALWLGVLRSTWARNQKWISNLRFVWMHSRLFWRKIDFQCFLSKTKFHRVGNTWHTRCEAEEVSGMGGRSFLGGDVLLLLRWSWKDARLNSIMECVGTLERPSHLLLLNNPSAFTFGES